MARGQPRPCEPRPAEGDERNRALPHRGARRPRRALREPGVRPYARRLQLVRQQALPEVPGRGVAPMAGRPRSGAVARPILSRRLHAAGQAARHRLPEQARGLRPPDEGGGRDDAHPSSARAHDRARRRALARRIAMGRLSLQLPRARQPAGAPVQRQDARRMRTTPAS